MSRPSPQTTRPRATALLGVAFACGLAGCSETPTERRFIGSDGRHLRDADGRAVLLRGINARVRNVFDVDLGPGRVPLENIPEFDAGDAARLAELGFNFLRLPIHWSGVEPRRGEYDLEYLEEVARVVELCAAHEIFVLLDLHQDAWSKEIGEDGAPLWAIEPPPTRLLEGPLHDLEARRLSPEVTAAFRSFFGDDPTNLQASFAGMLQVVARRFASHPFVLGYELFNEPQATEEELLRFHRRMTLAVRAVDTEHLIAFEPPVYRNFTNAAELAEAPFPDDRALYAPHIYTGVLGGDSRLAEGTHKPAVEASWAAARKEAEAWRTPLLIGEFGVGPSTTNGARWIEDSFDQADALLASTAWWLWKEDSQGRWGLFEPAGPEGWIERTEFARSIARPYARAIGGDPVTMRWDGTTLSLEVTPREGVEPIHDLFLPSGVPAFTCRGAAVAPDEVKGRVFRVRCPEGRLEAKVGERS